MESTLLRVIGALFCHDAKRARTRTGKIHLNKGAEEKHIEILPHPNYGQPGPLAHKTLIALLKKHSDYGRPIQRDVSFSKRELSRLIGRVSGAGATASSLHLRSTAFRALSSQQGSKARMALTTKTASRSFRASSCSAPTPTTTPHRGLHGHPR